MSKLLEQLESHLITEDQIVEKFQLSDHAIALLEAGIFMETETLDEALNFKGLLGKLGLKAHKGTGLIQILGKAGKNMAEMMWYAFKAAKGDEAAKVKLAEILKTKIKKEDVINFLYQLDMATAHLVTGPIHMIDAITGWHIAPNLHSAASTTEIIRRAIKELEDASKKLVGAVKNKIVGYVGNIKSVMSIA